MQIREITKADDSQVANLIRTTLAEFGADKPGFAWQDPELDHMTRAYSNSGRVYLVIEYEGRIVGGGGIGEFTCSLKDCCELQKMYLFPEARGKGWGLELIARLLESAKAMGYCVCYLESLESMQAAMGLYQKMGFRFLDAPLGDSGHNACDRWMLKEI